MQNNSHGNHRFRIQAKHLFLTYPRCDAEKEIVWDLLMDKFRPERILVAGEKHADGGRHLHCYLGFQERKSFTGADFADLIILDKYYHGNYEACRSVNSVLKYATKDGDWKANFDIKQAGTAKQRRVWAANKVVHEEAKLEDLILEEPELIFGYASLDRDINLYRRQRDSRKILHLPPFLPNPWGLVFPSSRHAKRRHYWLYSSRPNVGKSYHFARPLAEEYGAVIQSGDFSYWNVCIGVRCIILDEYNTALLKYSQLNSICDGTFGFRVFHGGVVKLDQPLLIVLSNQSISSLYPHMHELLYARFIEKKLD